MKFNSKDTVLTVANAIELSTQIVANLAGDEIGNSLNGQTLKTDDIRDIVALRTQTYFSNNLRVRD